VKSVKGRYLKNSLHRGRSQIPFSTLAMSDTGPVIFTLGPSTDGDSVLHYYKRNIGDYAKKAGRLSMLEHGAYTLLIDACYDREQFPTRDEAIEWCWARTSDEILAVEFVLSRFFDLVDGIYVQKRIEEELAKYHENAARNSRIATEREKRRTERARSVEEAQTNLHEAPPNQEPLTINQEPLTINTPIPPAKPGAQSPKPTAAVSLPAWLAAVKAKGEKPIPDDDPVFDYADQANIPMDLMRLCWLEFRVRYSEPNAKRYKDWRSVYRKAVRGNWLKLWFLTEDGYGLTTAGQQAQRALDAKLGSAA
jgi:uncharacterized protein YdaU (DUF1376 family)